LTTVHEDTLSVVEPDLVDAAIRDKRIKVAVVIEVGKHGIGACPVPESLTCVRKYTRAIVEKDPVGTVVGNKQIGIIVVIHAAYRDCVA
jgi:hypothetical protein